MRARRMRAICAMRLADVDARLRRYMFWARKRLALTGRPGLEEVLAARRAAGPAGAPRCDAACKPDAS